MSYKGYYVPVHKEKYKGNPYNCVYRSLWERKMMVYFDLSSSIQEWNSEEIVVPYISPLDNKCHRYFPDFWIRGKDKQGNIFEALIEVKPKKQVDSPVLKHPSQKRKYLMEMKTWAVNQSKWDAAKTYCEQRKWKFIILTEKTINGQTSAF